MDIIVFLKGLLIGFAMAIPVGPIGVLCIRKTLSEGHSRGLIVGLGGATADSLYGGVAAFGLKFVSDVIVSEQLWVHLLGGGLLLYLGFRTIRAKRKDPILPFGNKGSWGSFVSAFILALTNPLTMFAFVAVFAAFGLGARLSFLSAGILVTGVFSGTCLWFFTLGFVATLFRRRLKRGGLVWVNRVSGGLIILSGMIALVSLV
jgi:threonine/homoserine/homoserine lactone efflux protein